MALAEKIPTGKHEGDEGHESILVPELHLGTHLLRQLHCRSPGRREKEFREEQATRPNGVWAREKAPRPVNLLAIMKSLLEQFFVPRIHDLGVFNRFTVAAKLVLQNETHWLAVD